MLHYDLNWLKERVETDSSLDFIYFWGHTNKSGEEVGKFCMSQWYPSPFIVEGIEYKTAEHWMMAQKALLFGDAESFNKAIECEKPDLVKKIGQQVKGFDSKIWDAKKFEIVRQGNIHKFSQIAPLGAYLKSTGNSILVEASPYDKIWGVGLTQNDKEILDVHTWKGENLLGFALMETRDFLSYEL